jgi:hypothetical protein
MPFVRHSILLCKNARPEPFYFPKTHIIFTFLHPKHIVQCACWWGCSLRWFSCAQYVTLQKYFSHPSLVILLFGTPPITTETLRQQIGGVLLITKSQWREVSCNCPLAGCLFGRGAGSCMARVKHGGDFNNNIIRIIWIFIINVKTNISWNRINGLDQPFLLLWSNQVVGSSKFLGQISAKFVLGKSDFN